MDRAVEAERYTSLRAAARAADLVVVGTVTTLEPGRIVGDVPAGQVLLGNLAIRIERVLRGTWGADLITLEIVIGLPNDGIPRIDLAGDEAIFLVRAKGPQEPGRYRLISSQGVVVNDAACQGRDCRGWVSLRRRGELAVAVVLLFSGCSAPRVSLVPPGSTSTSVPSIAEVTEGQYYEAAVDDLPVFADTTDTAFVLKVLSDGQGTTLFGSEQVDGIQWHRVEVISSLGSVEPVYGWIPAEMDGMRTLTEVDRACPPELSISFVAVYEPEQRRLCAAAEEISLTGYLNLQPGDPLYRGTPAFLAEQSMYSIAAVRGSAVEGGSLSINLPPGVSIEGVDQTVRQAVTGHYNDSRATSCLRDPARESLLPETPEEQVRWCLQQFVLTSIEAIPD